MNKVKQKLARKSFIPPSKNQADQFKDVLICENKRRFGFLLSIVFLSQLAFLIVELINKTIWTSGLLPVRAIVAGICLFFISLLYLFERIKKIQLRMKSLGFVSSTIQFVSMLAGCYFVVFMFKRRFHQLQRFYLVSFLVSLTCVRRPQFSSIMLVLFFLGLTAYLGISFCFL